MITDLVQIRRLGENKRDENERFRRFLKSHNFVERQFRRIAQQVEDSIDCTVCANCCREATVRLNERDIPKLAKFLGVKPGVFIRDYTEETEDEGLILKRSEEGCIFLEETTCTVYEARPHNCEYFPHLLRGEGSLQSRMWEFKDRACYCPIVYNTLEKFKEDSGFRG
ncbi:MAG TPA: YkgJ family cysteine cluster protein [Bryobacteraceae bacterium]|nr:YkgJ family cysteine cluster protein [Bryobacteraceae bacterium]